MVVWSDPLPLPFVMEDFMATHVICVVTVLVWNEQCRSDFDMKWMHS